MKAVVDPQKSAIYAQSCIFLKFRNVSVLSFMENMCLII